MKDIGDLRSFETLVAIMDRLRGPGGCPWDLEQSVETLRKYFLEETHEALDAADRRDFEHLAEELGDVLLEVVFMAKVCQQEGRFDIGDAIEHINRKLIRRHPHIFADAEATDADAVFRKWHQLKMEEGKGDMSSILQEIPLSLPALLRAYRLSERVSKVGFDWESISQVMEKYQEEWDEFKQALESGNPEAIEHELGDLLFTLVNVGRFVNVCAEEALRSTAARFIERFAKVEEDFKARGIDIRDATLEEMEQVWQKVKGR